MPWWLRAPGLLLLLPFMAPLRGKDMSGWLYDALDAMDEGPQPAGGATLMPPEHRLDLFVTATDFYGYDRDLIIEDPPLVKDHAHRHVLDFQFGDGRDDFTRADNGWLALAGRVTSSIPGAFPPVRMPDIEAWFGELPDPARFFRIYQLSDAEPSNTAFVDGGVLDNRPFGHAIRAIRRCPAESEVNRCLVFLEPDPSQRGAGPDGRAPRPLASILSAAVGLPRQEPIVDDILEVSRHNERVERVRDIIELAFPTVAERVASVLDTQLDELVGMTAGDTPGRWRDRLNEDAQEAVGVAYDTYLRSKVSGVVDRYARTICDLSRYPEDCNQAAFVRAALRAWARARLFKQRDGRPAPQDDYVDFLRRFDLDYGIRRMRFVIDALSWWYREAGVGDVPARAELDCGKAALYETQSELVDAAAGKASAWISPTWCAIASPRRWSTIGSGGPTNTSRSAPRSSRGSSGRSARPLIPTSREPASGCSTRCSRSCGTGAPGFAATCSPATSASRIGTPSSTRFRPSPTSANGTRSRSSGSVPRTRRRSTCRSRSSAASSGSTSVRSSTQRAASATISGAGSTALRA